jgi:hypothetical protein
MLGTVGFEIAIAVLPQPERMRNVTTITPPPTWVNSGIILANGAPTGNLPLPDTACGALKLGSSCF